MVVSGAWNFCGKSSARYVTAPNRRGRDTSCPAPGTGYLVSLLEIDPSDSSSLCGEARMVLKDAVRPAEETVWGSHGMHTCWNGPEGLLRAFCQALCSVREYIECHRDILASLYLLPEPHLKTYFTLFSPVISVVNDGLGIHRSFLFVIYPIVWTIRAGFSTFYWCVLHGRAWWYNCYLCYQRYVDFPFVIWKHSFQAEGHELSRHRRRFV